LNQYSRADIFRWRRRSRERSRSTESLPAAAGKTPALPGGFKGYFAGHRLGPGDHGLLVWIINRYAFSSGQPAVGAHSSVSLRRRAIAFGLVIPLLNLNRRNAARKRRTKIPRIPGAPAHAGRKAQRRRLTRSRSCWRPTPCASPNPASRSAWLPPAPSWIPDLGRSRRRRAAVADQCRSRLSRLRNVFAVGRRAEIRQSCLLRHRRYARRSRRAPQGRSIGHRAAARVSIRPRCGLFAQYRGTSKWEQVDMQPSPGASTYEFLFSSLATTSSITSKPARSNPSTTTCV
jgi:hypothetical protein